MFQILIRRIFCSSLCAFTLLYVNAIPMALAHEGHHEHAVIKAGGGDFTLNGTAGPVSLKDFRGKVVALYFGYTHCMDACPLDLSKLGHALKSMKPDEVDQIQPIFISVDPARDDVKILANYSLSFHPKLIGLTGSDSEIDAVSKLYGVTYEKGPVNASGEYDIEHPSDIFLVNKDGKFLRSLPKGTSPEHITIALRKELKTKH